MQEKMDNQKIKVIKEHIKRLKGGDDKVIFFLESSKVTVLTVRKGKISSMIALKKGSPSGR